MGSINGAPSKRDYMLSGERNIWEIGNKGDLTQALKFRDNASS